MLLVMAMPQCAIWGYCDKSSGTCKCFMKSDVLICDSNGVQNFIWLVIASPLVVSQMNQSRVVQNSQHVGQSNFYIDCTL